MTFKKKTLISVLLTYLVNFGRSQNLFDDSAVFPKTVYSMGVDYLTVGSTSQITSMEFAETG